VHLFIQLIKNLKDMKNIIKLMMVVGLIGVLLPSCDLEKLPSDEITRGTAFETMDDARAWNRGLHVRLRNRLNGNYALVSEMQSDLFNATSGYGNRGGNVHRLDNALPSDNGYVADIWAGYYRGITEINLFLENVPKIRATIQDTSSAAPERLELAEIERKAHYMRAYFYYGLIRNFGDAYTINGVPNPTLDEPFGVPLVTTFNTSARPERVSVRRIYNFILEELELAEGLHRLESSPESRLNISENARLALLSKIHLLMGNYGDAARIAQDLINDPLYELVDNEDDLRFGWEEDGGMSADGRQLNTLRWREDIFLIGVSASEPSQLNSIFSERRDIINPLNLKREERFSPDFIPTQTVVNLFSVNDIRTYVYLSNPHREFDIVYISSRDREGVVFVNKWPQTLRFGNQWTYIHAPKVARIAEQYLIAAEALHRSGKTPEGEAILEQLRTARGLTERLSSETDFETVLRNEWTREMIGEGVRIENMKRWGIGFDGRPPQKDAKGDAPVMEGSEYDERQIPAGCFRLVLPMPEWDLRYNQNLKQTPGWVSLTGC
jgi:hypothetical protein